MTESQVKKLDDLIDDVEVHRPGQEVLTEALDTVGMGLGDLPRPEVVVVDAAHRVDPDDLDVGVLLLEVLADAADRAAGAETGDEHVDLGRMKAKFYMGSMNFPPRIDTYTRNFSFPKNVLPGQIL